ncbi:MAG: RDD family protein [Deltaproteobacteria bacterium]|nr:RDD family protein [Deltaproteobacteria bacterium]
MEKQGMLDTTREIEVPEGVELSLAVAGLVSRSLAFMIDLIVRWVGLGTVSGILEYLGNFGQGLFLILVFVVEWFYPVLFEVFNQGQTIGKKSMGIMVINDDGTPTDWSSSIVRNLLRFADFLPMLFGFGVLSMLINKDFKRLGDLAAGTLVVHRRKIKEEKLSYEEEGLAPKISLTLEEQSAIISFAERSSKMSVSRTHELASYLGPWLEQDKTKKNPENEALLLKRMAKWLRGHQ